MPSTNSIKQFVENAFYHVYNRGVEKRQIFLDDQDFRVLLFYFKTYLSSFEELKKIIDKKIKLADRIEIKNLINARFNNFYGRIELHAYNLLPNHFHLILKQIGKFDMTSFMRSIFTKYSMYFNKRYRRVGKLFQGVYKAKQITHDTYLMHLSRYIHLNSKEMIAEKYPNYQHWTSWRDYPYSSCRYYLQDSDKAPVWLKRDFILGYFNSNQYLHFLEEYNQKKDLDIISDGILERDIP